MSVSKKKKKSVGARKKKRSKITPPKNPTNPLIAFRADSELRFLLKDSPNKSEVIQTALREYFAKTTFVTCTYCNGTGKMKTSK